MASVSAHPTGDLTRPYNGLILLAFLVTSLVGLGLTMYEPISNGIPLGFREMVDIGRFPNGTPIIREYTGLAPLDRAISEISSAFVPGALRWDPNITIHQLHFLVQFLAVNMALNVEACRIRGAGKWASRQWFWVLLYQTCSGAFAIPMVQLVSLLGTSKNSHYTSGRAVPLSYAKSLMPALLLGYLLPTAALYFPWGNVKLTSMLSAVWQPCPLYPNILLFIFSSLASSAPSTQSSKKQSQRTSDVAYLKTLYKVVGAICLVNHLVTVYLCFTSPDPLKTLSYIFVPDKANRILSVPAGLHYIFQMDWIFTLGASLAWAWVSVGDARRLAPGSTPNSWLSLAWNGLKIVLMATILGPGTYIAVLWSWKEDKLVQIEQSSSAAKSK